MHNCFQFSAKYVLKPLKNFFTNCGQICPQMHTYCTPEYRRDASRKKYGSRVPSRPSDFASLEFASRDGFSISRPSKYASLEFPSLRSRGTRPLIQKIFCLYFRLHQFHFILSQILKHKGYFCRHKMLY